MNPHNIPEGSTALITGATGFTGSALAWKLAKKKVNISAIARESSDISRLDGLNITWYIGDVFDPKTVTNAAENAEYVFHLATAYRQGGTGEDYFRKVHIESTKLLAQTCLKNKAFKRFVHVSTCGVHGHIEGKPADENHPFAPGDAYQKTKAEAELWLRNFISNNDLPAVILRPTGIYGPRDKRLLKLFKLAAGRFFPILGKGKCLYHLIHVEDLTNIMISAAVHPSALNEVFLCGNREPIPLREIAAVVAETLGNRQTVVRLPAWPLFVAAKLCETVCRPLGLPPPLYRRRVAFFTKDRMFNTEKLRNVLEYQQVYSNRQGIAQTVEWYLEHGWLKNK